MHTRISLPPLRKVGNVRRVSCAVKAVLVERRHDKLERDCEKL
jgi:hypothetical protein